jgi:hypothetical protein
MRNKHEYIPSSSFGCKSFSSETERKIRSKRRRDRELEKRAELMAERRSRKIDESEKTTHNNI